MLQNFASFDVCFKHLNRTADEFIGEYLKQNDDFLLVTHHNTWSEVNLINSEYDECTEEDMSRLVKSAYEWIFYGANDHILCYEMQVKDWADLINMAEIFGRSNILSLNRTT